MRSWMFFGLPVVVACSAADPSAVSTTMRSPTDMTGAAADVSVPFDTGFTFGPHGDEIHVDEVRGDHDTFVVGSTYRIRGHYVLRSQPQALLAAYVMNGHIDESAPSHRVVVSAGLGTFDLRMKIVAAGYPHVGFYPMPRGDGFAETFIGRGDTLYAHGWAHAGE